MALVRSRPVLHHPFAPWLAPPDQLARTLVGREEALRNVIEKIEAMGKGGAAKHVLIISPRGMGKTHLVCFIHHYVSQNIKARPDLPALPKNWTSVLFVEEEYAAHDTLANFLLALCSKLHEADPDEEAWQLPETLRDQTDRAVTDCCFERIQEFSTKRGKKLLILVDNIQKILRQFPTEDHHRLRAFLMDQTAVLLLGTAPWLFKEVIEYKAPFFEFFETLYLSDLTEEEMLRLLEARFQEDGFEGDFRKREEDLNRKIPAIRKLTGGNPRLILFLYQIVTRSAFLEVESALRELIEELSDYFRSRYDALADQPRKILDTLAQMEGPSTPTEVARAARLSVQKVNAQLKRLKGWGYVEPAKHERRRATHYDVTERLFRIWRQTATVAGRQRFKFLAQFLKIYYTPEEMFGIAHTYRTELQARERLLPEERYRHVVEDLYYFQEASSGALSREIFRLRMETLLHVRDHVRAEQEAEHFLAASVHAKDLAGMAIALKGRVEVYAATGRHGRAFEDIRQLLKMGRNREALDASENLVEQVPTIPQAWVLKGLAERNLGDHTKALESFQRATALHGEEAYYWRLQADAFLNLRRYTEALACAERAVELAPKDARAWERRGFAASDLGDHAKALESFHKAMALEPDKEAGHMHNQAVALSRMGSHAEALARVERAIELKPGNAHFWKWRGIAAGNLGDHAKALESFQRATALEPGDPRYWALQAQALRRLERYTDALACAERAVELQPDDALAWIEIGWLAGDMRDYLKAYESFQKAATLKPKEALYWHLQAVALGELKRYAEALASAEQAVALQPDDAHFWEWRGRAAAKLADFAKALESFQKAAALQPEESRYWRLQANALWELERYAEGFACAERAVELQPNDVLSWAQRGWFAVELGHSERALESFHKAATLKPKEARYSHDQAMVLDRLGRHREALVCIQRAVVLQPDDAHYLIHKALTLGYLGRIEEAVATLDEAMQRKAPERDVLRARFHVLSFSGRFTEAREAIEKAMIVAPDDKSLLIDREIVRACQGEHGPNMERLTAAILQVEISTNKWRPIVRSLLEMAASCANRGDLDRARGLLSVALSLPWQQEEWFGKTLGVFLGKLLDGPPSAFEMAIDRVKEKVVEPNVLGLLNPYLQAAAYVRTGDASILDRLFPEVRELVLEISQRLQRRTSPTGNVTNGAPSATQ